MVVGSRIQRIPFDLLKFAFAKLCLKPFHWTGLRERLDPGGRIFAKLTGSRAITTKENKYI